mgnify:CR=1 FL=1
MSLFSKLKKKLFKKNLSHLNLVNNSKFIHFIYNDKFGQGFIDFINRNYNSKDHVFLTQNFINLPKLVGKNVIEIKDLKEYKISLNKDQKIICHSLFLSGVIDFFYKNILLNKTYWMIYGGDLYNANRSDKDDYVRKNFYGYITDVDKDILEPITMEMIQNAKKIKKDNKIVKIQINNSCDLSTIDMLNKLKKFKNENIKISTILSYGDLSYKDEIIKLGNSIFDKKFSYIDNMLSPEDYAKKTYENDILILNQNRQQGLGNSFLALQFGQKLFIRSNISTFDYLEKNGNKIFDSNDIENFSFKDFLLFSDEDKQKNLKNSKKFFEDNFIKDKWDNVFNQK